MVVRNAPVLTARWIGQEPTQSLLARRTASPSSLGDVGMVTEDLYLYERGYMNAGNTSDGSEGDTMVATKDEGKLVADCAGSKCQHLDDPRLSPLGRQSHKYAYFPSCSPLNRMLSHIIIDVLQPVCLCFVRVNL